MLQKTLEKMGFEEKEAKLYLALLELGEATVQDIARKSGLKRTTVYHLLDSLKGRGIISLTKKTKKVLYIARDPRTIGEDIKEKEAVFKKALPELLSIANMLEKKPTIKYFEGLEGIKEMYRDELRYPDSELLVFLSESYEIFGDEFFYDFYMPERIKRKIWARYLAQENEYMLDLKLQDEKMFRKGKLIKGEKQNMELEISVYGKSMVSIKSFQEKFGILIESKAMFNTMKGIFEMQWQMIPDKKIDSQKVTEEDIYY